MGCAFFCFTCGIFKILFRGVGAGRAGASREALGPLVGPEPADASSAATSSEGCAPCRGVPGVLPGQAAAGLMLRLCARSPGDAGLDRTGSRNFTCAFAGAREGRRWSGSVMAAADFDGGLAAGLRKIAQRGIAQRRREDPGW